MALEFKKYKCRVDKIDYPKQNTVIIMFFSVIPKLLVKSERAVIWQDEDGGWDEGDW